MDLASFQELLTPGGQVALSCAQELEPREPDYLRHIKALEKRFPPQLARAALETAILRGEAAAKFPLAERMYFTRPALEQATAWEVAAYRAERYRPFDCIADLGCSIGGDTLALAQVRHTLGIDQDPLRLAMARANLDALGLAERALLIRSNLLENLPLSASGGASLGLFFDPARRADEQRIFSVERYMPPLSTLLGWLPHHPALGVKISPGVDLDELRRYPAGVEFISLRGELKEGLLWFGPLKKTARQATVLPGPHCLASEELHGASREGSPLSEPQAYLYEPDPAVLRAGLVRDLGAQLAAAQLDPEIAYLTAARQTPTPFARAWAIEDWFPFGLKRLRAYLRQRGVGRVTVKKRGSPLQPEALIRDLRLRGDNERVVALTHLMGKPIVIICAV